MTKLSIIAVPKPFSGHIGVIQDNALGSWNSLPITRETILIGDETGVAEAAARAGALHYPQVRRDSDGTPLLDDIFRIAEEAAHADWLCYVNADIILMPEFAGAVHCAISTLGPCLIVSRRWNLDLSTRLRFDAAWSERLRAQASSYAELFSVYGIDVFVFPKGLFQNVPPFALGRSCWDNWIVAEARRQKLPVVDITEPFSVIHQNHAYSGFSSMADIRRSQQGLRNFSLAGDSYFLFGRIDDATHELRNGQIASSGRKAVSVLVRHMSTLGHLRHCLRALTHQSYPRSFLEIIVVDDWRQSSGAAAVLLEFPFVRMTSEEKHGAAAAKNKGAAIADGQILAFLDSNCSPSADWVEKVVAALGADGYASIAVSRVKFKRNRFASDAVQWYEAITSDAQRSNSDSEWRHVNSPLVVPRTIWTTNGPFDETLVAAPAETFEWASRTTLKDVPIVYAREAVITRRVAQTWHVYKIFERRVGAVTEANISAARSERCSVAIQIWSSRPFTRFGMGFRFLPGRRISRRSFSFPEQRFKRAELRRR